MLTATSTTVANWQTPFSGVAKLGSWDANEVLFPSGAAGAGTRNGHAVLNFDDTTDENVIIEGVMSADYSGGNLTVEIHWVAATATTGVGGWECAFETIADGGQDIDSDGFAAVQSGSDTTDGTSGVVTVTSIPFTQAQADSVAAGDAFRLDCNRDAGVGSDLVGDAQVLRFAMEQ